MVNRSGLKFAALVAIRDIYDNDEILLKYEPDHEGDYKVNQSRDGVTYQTKQLRFKTQGLWKQNRNALHPVDPVISHGLHQGQSYDKRYIAGIPH